MSDEVVANLIGFTTCAILLIVLYFTIVVGFNTIVEDIKENKQQFITDCQESNGRLIKHYQGGMSCENRN